jgi:hypothetical protein
MQKWTNVLLFLTMILISPCLVVAAQQELQLPSETLGVKQIEKLFSGQTVAAYSVDGKEQKLVIYFGTDGQVGQAKKGLQGRGKWTVSKDGRICLNL